MHMSQYWTLSHIQTRKCSKENICPKVMFKIGFSLQLYSLRNQPLLFSSSYGYSFIHLFLESHWSCKKSTQKQWGEVPHVDNTLPLEENKENLILQSFKFFIRAEWHEHNSWGICFLSLLVFSLLFSTHVKGKMEKWGKRGRNTSYGTEKDPGHKIIKI